MTTLIYQANGNLSPGIHILSWPEFEKEFGFNQHRKELIKGLSRAIEALKKCSCATLFVDGSFVSKKTYPQDYDACFNPQGMDFAKLVSEYPVFLDRSPGRQKLKQEFKGELFSSTALAAPPRYLYIDFFQKDRDDNPKGIIQLNLN